MLNFARDRVWWVTCRTNLQALLETEILKDDPDLRVEPNNPDTILTCNITGFYHPAPTITTEPGLALTKNGPNTQQLERITGSLSVAFQAKSATGHTLISDNVTSKYDEQFDSSGVSTSHGVMGSLSGTWGKLKGQKTEENTPPTDAQLRSRLLLDVVQQIAEHIVNTNEAMNVFLANPKGPIEEGDKQADGVPVTVLGATGVVGQRFVRRLAGPPHVRSHPDRRQRPQRRQGLPGRLRMAPGRRALRRPGRPGSCCPPTRARP